MSANSRIWPEICKIKDPQTRLALSTCSDEVTLKRLRIGFPECFGASEDASLIPLSALQSLSAEQYREEGARVHDDVEGRAELDWQGACTRCNIPLIGRWGEDEHLPSSVTSQLSGETKLGDVLMWQGEKGVVVDVGYSRGKQPVFLGLALASRIDLEA